MKKKMEELLHRHRAKMVITCEKTCPCWDIEALLIEAEAEMETKYSKWSLWYSGNRPMFATMDDMLKDAFAAGWQAAQSVQADVDCVFCDCVDPHFDLVEKCSECGKPPRL